MLRTHFCDVLHGGRVPATLEATDLVVCVIARTIVLAGLLTIVDDAREWLAARVHQQVARIRATGKHLSKYKVKYKRAWIQRTRRSREPMSSFTWNSTRVNSI